MLLALVAALNVPSLRELRAEITATERDGGREGGREREREGERETGVMRGVTQCSPLIGPSASRLGLLSQLQLLRSGEGAVPLEPAVCSLLCPRSLRVAECVRPAAVPTPSRPPSLSPPLQHDHTTPSLSPSVAITPDALLPPAPWIALKFHAVSPSTRASPPCEDGGCLHRVVTLVARDTSNRYRTLFWR